MSRRWSLFRRAGVLSPATWLALRRIGIVPLVVLGYAVAAVAPVVIAAFLPPDAGIDVGGRLACLVPASLLVVGGSWHRLVMVNWSFHEEGKTLRERVNRL